MIGSVIPGSSIVFLGGVLVGLHALELWQVVDAAVAGAILGDGLSYWIGHRYHAELRAMWPLRTHPELLERGQAYFAAHGGKSVFVGRFLGPLRAIVPVVAGMSRMPAGQFYTMNVLSACAWAAAHLLPGVLFGASLQVAGAVSSRLVALVALVVLGLWLVAQATRLAIRFGWPYVSRMCRRALIRASKGSGVIARLALPLVDPARREPGTLFVAAVLLIGGTWLFFGVIEDLLTRDALLYADRGVYEWLQAIRTGWGDDVMVTITQLGGAPVLIPVVAAVGAWFAVTRRWRTLAYWVAATAIAELLVFALKHAFGRARPEAALALVDGFSFPSGHAALSVVVYGFLAFLLGNRKPGWQRTGLVLAAVCIAALTAFSRLYLGAHWLSDVIASFGLGTAWIALLAIAYVVHVRERPPRAAPVLLIVLATLIVVGVPYAGSRHDRELARYAKSSEVPTLRFAAWQAGGWRTLPAARAEIRGQDEEPLSVQWIATAETITAAMEMAGWHIPAAWASRASLLWLLPSTPIGELPVLPKFYRGQPPALTFIRPVDARTRVVLRLWQEASVTGDDAPPRPLWIGMLTTERSRAELGLVAATRTTDDSVAPAGALAAVIHDGRAAVETRPESDREVLLMW